MEQKTAGVLTISGLNSALHWLFKQWFYNEKHKLAGPGVIYSHNRYKPGANVHQPCPPVGVRMPFESLASVMRLCSSFCDVDTYPLETGLTPSTHFTWITEQSSNIRLP